MPDNLYMYPEIFREKMNLFYNYSITNEDVKKTKMYKTQLKREAIKEEFSDITDYLKSLELNIEIFCNDNSIIPRMSQMTQKVNQFNLTTKRYTEIEIKNFVEKPNYEVFAFSVSDKFGDSGICGLCIIKKDNDIGFIDTFLMSCRIIGRNLEYSFIKFLLNSMKNNGIKQIKSGYIKTFKNDQVNNFYDKCSFQIVEKNNSEKKYSLDLNNYKIMNTNYIKVTRK